MMVGGNTKCYNKNQNIALRRVHLNSPVTRLSLEKMNVTSQSSIRKENTSGEHN